MSGTLHEKKLLSAIMARGLFVSEIQQNTNLLLTGDEGSTGEYLAAVVAVQKRPMGNIPQDGSS